MRNRAQATPGIDADAIIKELKSIAFRVNELCRSLEALERPQPLSYAAPLAPAGMASYPKIAELRAALTGKNAGPEAAEAWVRRQRKTRPGEISDPIYLNNLAHFRIDELFSVATVGAARRDRPGDTLPAHAPLSAAPGLRITVTYRPPLLPPAAANVSTMRPPCSPPELVLDARWLDSPAGRYLRDLAADPCAPISSCLTPQSHRNLDARRLAAVASAVSAASALVRVAAAANAVAATASVMTRHQPPQTKLEAP